MMKQMMKLVLGVAIGLSSAAQAMENSDLNFYDKGEPFYEFTNFFEASFDEPTVGKWKTSEHYFQGKKFDIPSTRDISKKVMKATTSREVFKIAQDNKASIRPGWHGTVAGQSLKDNVMRDGLRLKFAQNPQLAALLMATKGLNLVENTAISTQNPKDSYWGNAYDGEGKPGKNMLGKILMEIRHELHKGTTEVDCTKTGVQITPVTQQALSNMGKRQRMFKRYFSRICSGTGQTQSSSARYSNSASSNLTSSTNSSRNFSSENLVAGKEESVAWALQSEIDKLMRDNYGQGLAFDFRVEITPTGNMLINTHDVDAAQYIVSSYLTPDLSGLEGAAVDFQDSRKVFIPKNQISVLLSILRNQSENVVAGKEKLVAGALQSEIDKLMRDNYGQGVSFDFDVQITPTGNMLINTRDVKVAHYIASSYLTPDYSDLQGVAVDWSDPKKVFIPKDQIPQLLDILRIQ